MARRAPQGAGLVALAGVEEGARWQCVRAHASALQDDSVFYTTTSTDSDRPPQGSVWGVTFKDLWTTWTRSFSKSYNIPNGRVVTKLQNNTLRNYRGEPQRKDFTLNGMKSKDYSLDAGSPAKMMEWV